MPQVYLNGSFLDADNATVSVNDRGFLFADGVYEVIRAYPGGMFLAEQHMDRLRYGLEALRIDPGAADGLLDVAERLLHVNGHRGIDSTVYLQVTRGAAPRKHAFPPAGTPPTIYVATRAFRGCPADWYSTGCATITVPDNRWARCDIKSVALLPNVLANQAAHDVDAFEALFVRDGVVVEGSHANFFAVMDGVVITYPASNYILKGITRTFVVDLAAELGIPVEDRGLLLHQVGDVQEAFLCGTTTEVLPIASIDGNPVGNGRAGPITRQLLEAFRERLPGTPAARH